jgi:hypothetical protein
VKALLNGQPFVGADFDEWGPNYRLPMGDCSVRFQAELPRVVLAVQVR